MSEAQPRILITGAAGFLGWHLRCYLHSLGMREVTALDRDGFSDTERLRKAVDSCDVVFHLAGLNRAPNAEILTGNPAIASALATVCQQAGARPHMVFANSVHAAGDSAYGRSKRDAAAILSRWAQANGARFTDVHFPHLFGEGGRPHYNSGIATFCHQIARGEQTRIIQDSDLELLHAQRAVELLLQAYKDGLTGEVRPPGVRLRVSEALGRLQDIAGCYRREIIPALDGPLDLDLFNTYRHYLFPQNYPVRPTQRTDARGGLFEAVRSLHGGQTFISSTIPGATRGDHYHRRKVERFLVLRGKAVIRIRRMFREEVHEFPVSGESPVWIDMPSLHTHNITNVGESELITMFWAHEIFDPARPDTYREKV